MTNFDGPAIGARITRYRKMNGWSMAELADRTLTPINQPVIANIENGRKKDLSVEQLLDLAGALEVSPAALLFDIERPSDDSGLQIRRGVGRSRSTTIWQAMNWVGGNPQMLDDASPPASRATASTWWAIERAEHLRSEATAAAMQAADVSRRLESASAADEPLSASDLQLLDHLNETASRRFAEYRAAVDALTALGVEYLG